MSQRTLKTAALSLMLCAPRLALAGEPLPKEIPGARKLFGEAIKVIEKEYVDQELSQDRIWTLALQGVLSGLIQDKEHHVNRVISPQELKLLKSDLGGKISGTGLVIKSVEGMAIIRAVLPNGPAAKANIQPGDRILAIDKTPVKDKPFGEIIGLIRGPTGTTVDLLVQREQDEWVVPITRGQITLKSVVSAQLPDNVGYLKISNFSNNTEAQLIEQLKEVSSSWGLIIDLRDCPGGLLDQALKVADHFLAPGETIISVKGRDKKVKLHQASASATPLSRPAVVLISKETASSAEILAAALAENNRATLVGERTYGKGTVESLEKLAGGWALKLSVARFYSPQGNNWQDQGIQPHFEIKDDRPEERFYTTEPEVDPAKDAQLRAGLSVLALKRR